MFYIWDNLEMEISFFDLHIYLKWVRNYLNFTTLIWEQPVAKTDMGATHGLSENSVYT